MDEAVQQWKNSRFQPVLLQGCRAADTGIFISDWHAVLLLEVEERSIITLYIQALTKKKKGARTELHD